MRNASLSIFAFLWHSYIVFAQGRDCGSFQMSCVGAEGACNNACYYINCLGRTPGVIAPNPNRVTYIGNGQDAENSRNRLHSGCNAATGGSVCRNFPFSQDFINEDNRHLIAANDCDEWPPAASQQNTFVAGNIRNSLRCIPLGENRAAGARLGNFIKDVGPGRQKRNTACAGPLNRNDYFSVGFNITGADQTKLKYCLARLDCGQDGFQFHMTRKPTQNGKISSFYDPLGTDNRYMLSNQNAADELFQCSVKISRPDDNTFEYGVDDMDPDFLSWDSDDIGDGRGPATDAKSPYNYCKHKMGANGERVTECWFGCYE
ncbi:hypothetical protein VMCG_09368 [Cytospora schulzeri]|uniref:Deoxyribonuclease NucA/NucB domain-containing protein n=1 Tax=Cytospora schulzeri TaxID=448051 RepID=A0A423VJP0_9PEZI|nr:hypothetical protein VMCG_09368 [Valsa malicola]